MTNFLDGLRLDLRDAPVTVTEVCPGYVHTELVADYAKPAPMAMSAERAAQIIFAQRSTLAVESSAGKPAGVEIFEHEQPAAISLIHRKGTRHTTAVVAMRGERAVKRSLDSIRPQFARVTAAAAPAPRMLRQSGRRDTLDHHRGDACPLQLNALDLAIAAPQRLNLFSRLGGARPSTSDDAL